MTGIDLSVKALADSAVELGAAAARPLSAREVVVDPRVRLKCITPRCSGYGRNLMCPPFVPTPDEFAGALARYDNALVVQQAIPLTPADIKRRFRGKDLGQLEASETYTAILRDSQAAFSGLMTRLETEALESGHALAAALDGGECALCPVCTAAEAAPGGPVAACRHPFAARPSMEAVGIDVVRTAAAAGLDVRFPTDEPRWTGLLLVD
jgi:predicted metal-binding protein